MIRARRQVPYTLHDRSYEQEEGKVMFTTINHTFSSFSSTLHTHLSSLFHLDLDLTLCPSLRIPPITKKQKQKDKQKQKNNHPFTSTPASTLPSDLPDRNRRKRLHKPYTRPPPLPLPKATAIFPQPCPSSPIIAVMLAAWDKYDWKGSADALADWLNARWVKSGYVLGYADCVFLLRMNGRVDARRGGGGEGWDGGFVRTLRGNEGGGREGCLCVEEA